MFSNTAVKSLQSVGSHKDKKYDTIPFRLEFIKELWEGNSMAPLMQIDNCQTEDFVNPSGYRDNCTTEQVDIRDVINKNLHDFYDVIKTIGGRLMYVKSGTTGHTFKGKVKCDDGTKLNYAVKVVAYPKREKYGDPNDIRRPENAELMMIRLLSYLVIKKQTPHIVLPIGTFNTSIEPFVNLIEDNVVDHSNKKYADFVERYSKGDYYDNVSILVSEWANKGDLLDFMRNNYREFSPMMWKVIFFQFLSVLAVIQYTFPDFRHNDLKANNILIHKIKKKKSKMMYTVNRCKYTVPAVGYHIKMWDFDFACIPGIVDNAKVSAKWTDGINVLPKRNRYYDMHYFFNTLIKKGFFPQFMEEDCVPVEAKEFVKRVVPEKYRTGEHVAKRGRVLVDDEYTTPDKVLKTDPYFAEFRVKTRKNKKICTS